MTGPINQQIPNQYEPINTPSKPMTEGAATGRNQKDRRYTDTFWDNHRSARFPNGRPWCGEREIAANTELMHEDGFVQADLMQGEYVEDDFNKCDRIATLRATWTSPWRPLAKYFRFNYPKKRITFDYVKMRAEEERSLEEYYEAAAILGANLNVGVEYGVMPSFQIRAKIGNPTKYLKIAEAAIAGDPWLLGHIDEPNPELAAILGFNQRGMRVTSYTPPEPVAIVTPAQVVAASPPELMELLRNLTATVAQLSAESAARHAKGEQMRAGKKKNTRNLAGASAE